MRTITLDPVMDAEPLHVQPVRPESTLGCGLRLEWLTAEDQHSGTSASLAAGAGVGSPYLILHAERDGLSVWEYIDVRPLMAAWIDAALDRGATPEPEREQQP